FGRQRRGDFALLQQSGVQRGYSVHSVNGFLLDGERVSSTAVRDYLAQGDCSGAARLLGRPYCMSGEVVHGRKLGRELGMPTANIELSSPALPLVGIYVVEAAVGDTTYAGVASVGYRPTVSATKEPSLEVHILDFNGDLYGQTMDVHFLHKLRDEEKFADLEALKAAMAKDLADTRAYFQRHPLKRN